MILRKKAPKVVRLQHQLMCLPMMKSHQTVQYLLDELLWDIYGKASLRENKEDADFHRKSSVITTKHGSLHICPNSWKYPVRVLREQSIQSLTQISASLRLEIRIIGAYLTTALISRDRKRRKQQTLCDIVTACLQALSNKSAEAKDMKFKLSPPSPPICGKEMNVASSDFNQWLHAMKMVARLPGGMPPEFRRKLWLALADRYLQTKDVDWRKEQEKCFSEQWREDDEELGIQIVKDLHRTGSSLCSGPAGSLNQAKLKRVLLGYARWNPEVGYCQGFNMLGALILQVMDKNEDESMKVMIFLIEGVLPSGYFSGSLSGLQADMAVFRELMQSRLPKLAKHLQRLQGPLGEGSFEPPLTNVFTMQWFLTLFCTCLPINCVLRVWDLTLIEGSDILLRTALAIWNVLEGKIISMKTADDFYCRMGTLSGELLNGHLIDSNGLIEKVVELGPITELQKLREKHRYNIAPWQDKKGLRLFYSDDEGDSDEESRLAVATVWGLRLNRRGSSSSSSNKPTNDNKDRIALDISILKKQYDRLKERQKQAHIILTAAAKQGVNAAAPAPPLQVNQLLMGRNAIVTHKGRRIGPPMGAIPPVRKTPAAKPTKQVAVKQTKRGETLLWHDTEAAKRRKSSITLKDTSNETPKPPSAKPTSSKSNNSETSPVVSSRTRKRSESSSYSEDSDANSSTSTSLCDDDDMDPCSSLEASPRRKFHAAASDQPAYESEVPDIVLTKLDKIESESKTKASEIVKEPKAAETIDEDSSAECDRFGANKLTEFNEEIEAASTSLIVLTQITGASTSLDYASETEKSVNYLDVAKSPLAITSTSQLSPIADISTYLSASSISPLRTPSTTFNITDLLASKSEEVGLPDTDDSYDASEEGVTNEYFERVNLVERPTKLDLLYSLNDRPKYSTCETNPNDDEDFDESIKPQEVPIRDQDDSKVTETRETNLVKHLPEALLTAHFKPFDAISPSSPSSLSISKNAKTIPTHRHIDKEKSFSFDDAIIVERTEPRPTSCPEARADIVEGKSRSDRVLKIIEENSMILHRILKKNAINIEEEPENAEDEENEKDNKEADSIDSYESENKLSLAESRARLSDITAELKEQLQKVEEAYNRSSSRSHSRTEIPLKYDDNIADRLASIKNTIKSIDSLCDDRTYEKEKCQRYIDAMFEKGTPLPPSIEISEPKSDHNSNSEYKINHRRYSPDARYSRHMRREGSPRRRMDEDREEYESRARRDDLDKLSTALKDDEHSRSNSMGRNNNRTPNRWSNPSPPDEDYKIQNFTLYTPNKIEIRHTTVTSTMYDRYLYQKKERDAKVEKSPPSPVITKAYLDSLKPNSDTRYAKSAESSPSRERFRILSPVYVSPSPTSPKDIHKDIQIRSCDNILMQLKNYSNLTSTTTTQPYSSLSPSESHRTSLIRIEPYKGPLDRSADMNS